MANETKQQPKQQTPQGSTTQPQQGKEFVPAVSQPPTSLEPPPTNWHAEAEAYLKANHWESLGGGLWADPAGSMARAKLEKAVDLPTRGGSFETIYQMTGPPAPWTYDTGMAVRHQQDRDKKGQKLASPLTQLQDLQKKHDKLAYAHEVFIEAIRGLVALPGPAKVEEIGTFKQRMLKAIHAAKEAVA